MQNIRQKRVDCSIHIVLFWLCILEEALRAEKAQLHQRKTAEKKHSTLYSKIKRPRSAIGSLEDFNREDQINE